MLRVFRRPDPFRSLAVRAKMRRRHGALSASNNGKILKRLMQRSAMNVARALSSGTKSRSALALEKKSKKTKKTEKPAIVSPLSRPTSVPVVNTEFSRFGDALLAAFPPGPTETIPSLFWFDAQGFVLADMRTEAEISKKSTSSVHRFRMDEYKRTDEVCTSESICAGPWTVSLCQVIAAGDLNCIYHASHREHPGKKFAAKIGPLSNDEVCMAMYMGAAGVGPRVYDAWVSEHQDVEDEDDGSESWSDDDDADGQPSEEPVVMIMDFIDGESLTEVVHAKGVANLSYLDAATLENVCTVSREMGRHHVIHGDYHSNQVMVERKTGRCYVVDWERANYSGHESKRSLGSIFGELIDDDVADESKSEADSKWLQRIRSKISHMALPASKPSPSPTRAELEKELKAHLSALESCFASSPVPRSSCRREERQRTRDHIIRNHSIARHQYECYRITKLLSRNA